MNEETKIDPKHSNTRRILRILGPTLTAIGLMLIGIGMGSFFSAFGTFEPPRYFWCVFVGMPLLAVGLVMCQFGFLGAVSRYIFAEAAPVQKDTFNYLAEGTKGGIKTIVTAVGEGISTGMGPQAIVRCSKCETSNDFDAKFCKTCGSPLTQ